MKKIKLKFFTIILATTSLMAQQYPQPLVSAIKEKDLKTDMYQLAADEFWGREAGTLDELKVSMWLADKAKAAGMQPAGENGTFFQFFDMYRHQIAPQSFIKINNNELKIWKDILVADVVNANFDGQIVYAGQSEPEELTKFDLKGKVLAINASEKDIAKNMTLFERRYPGFIRKKYYAIAEKLGAKGIIFITDDISEKSWAEVLPQMTRGLYGVEGLREKVVNGIPVFWIHRNHTDWVKNNPHISYNIITESYKYPSVNIIGKIEGTDPKLKNEYVLLSGHQDHDGIRHPVKNDTIYNGADDNASTCVAMLAIARAYKKQPGKRSILFVFHGAEERGLLGSRWHSAHPVVPRENIVAVLNGDMIGRNKIDEAALLGGEAPHKNSDDLVKWAKEANDESTKFKYLKDWDLPEHPEYFYFRSDHVPYAKLGIPAVFFTSVLHHQYHQPQDESENINFKKLHKMTEWIYRTSWKVANEPERPKLLPNVQFER
ncbi:M20/M25/M40 family metallo-hydrolase [Ornithobacterium rhinotracheale]|uniref:Putative aminopeptidase n=2 Tax=Ornithobacterium rhinotracheale TaxID=28251 RepID=I4A1L5_ORNRL|nr:M20/M25/M40 family metallo-hydrolase [Ornithobacterium rhinotracheale]AFL97849.1 putative aminopeptidase [Ornithobacterium rhinotracheale DSM 15997]AIP99672.1 peptidase M28 [Ornithobacterium rhinotracheale ORT-UMN 88]KGB65909.1 peptidase M28 [Ornithobacterium rhinotracheale H06-030791]MBN3661528.1 M20/M25/M40 family metallo-hydrolase [Ornithobacterium rhinotracheale]MCK0193856.1 M20/M25/M40 family metallo-hydrolase [Ornithobacterium rhinotracheale]